MNNSNDFYKYLNVINALEFYSNEHDLQPIIKVSSDMWNMIKQDLPYVYKPLSHNIQINDGLYVYFDKITFYLLCIDLHKYCQVLFNINLNKQNQPNLISINPNANQPNLISINPNANQPNLISINPNYQENFMIEPFDTNIHDRKINDHNSFLSHLWYFDIDTPTNTQVNDKIILNKEDYYLNTFQKTNIKNFRIDPSPDKNLIKTNISSNNFHKKIDNINNQNEKMVPFEKKSYQKNIYTTFK
jgi:hypothetical protein